MLAVTCVRRAVLWYATSCCAVLLVGGEQAPCRSSLLLISRLCLQRPDQYFCLLLLAGMQRTRASSSLQRSLELEGGAAPPAPSPLGTASGTTPTTSTTSASAGGASRYFNTPRGRLLQTLASEAAAAQKERSLAGAREGLPPSYSQVLGVVDAALQGAVPSPSKIPRQASARAGSSVASEESAEAAAQMPVYRSPSKIPRPARLGLPQAPVTDENAFSLPSSPDKEQPTADGAAARFGRALSSSIENLQLNRY